MADRSEKYRHHAVSATVLFIGLLASLELYLERDGVDRPFGIGLWVWVSGSLVAIVVLRALVVESGVRRKQTVGWVRPFSLILCAIAGAYLVAVPLIVESSTGEKAGISSWLLAALAGGMILGISLLGGLRLVTGHEQSHKHS